MMPTKIEPRTRELGRMNAKSHRAAMEWEDARRAEYRSRVLPDQLDRARRRYAGLLREAIRGRRFDLLTPTELDAVEATELCGNVPASLIQKGD